MTKLSIRHESRSEFSFRQQHQLGQQRKRQPFYLHQRKLNPLPAFDAELTIDIMHFTKTLLASGIPLLAVCNRLKLKPRTISPPFHLLAIHSTSPVHLQPINARLGGFYIGERPETYCPQAPCPVVNQTGFIVANGKSFLVRASGIPPRNNKRIADRANQPRTSRSQEAKTSTSILTAHSPSHAPAAPAPSPRAPRPPISPTPLPSTTTTGPDRSCSRDPAPTASWPVRATDPLASPTAYSPT